MTGRRALQALASLLSRPIVVIVDGLDHLRIADSSDAKASLFNEDLSLLLAPECIVVYTVPINVHYDPGFAALHQQRFRYTLGYIKLWQGPRDRTPFEPGWAFMRELVSRRVDAGLFAPGVIERAISLSGGSFEQILRLLANAADSADYQALAQATDVHLDAAVKEIRADFVLLCGSWDHVRRLARVHQQHRIEVSAGDLEYLPVMAVLQQVNAAPWHMVNPVFIDYVLEPLLEIESQ